MCGIAGIYDRSASGRADPQLVEQMASTLQHRGPDGSGRFHWPQESPQVALGVRRLSVIDLQTGDQPLFNETGTIALVCNGEIYNYVELRTRLETGGHRFLTRSDAEVLVHLYEEFDLRLFKLLRGMYAFALWDSLKERLVLAVDHLGIKPLYLHEINDRLSFASEAKALLIDPRIPRRLNVPALDTYLSFGYMIGAETLIEGIRRIPPGHAIVLEGRQTRLFQHWNLHSALPPPPREQPGLSATIGRLLAESMRLQMRSDVPLGLFLSGGIDSTAILALMTNQGNGLVRTFSVGYEGRSGRHADETQQAALAASHFGARHRELHLSADEWWHALEEYACVLDEPIADPSAVSMLPLARLATREVKVVLTGLGGDELFRGYPFHFRLPKDLRTSNMLRRKLPIRPATAPGECLWTNIEALYPWVRRYRLLSGALALLIERRRVLLPQEEILLHAMSYEGLTSSARLRARLYGPALTAARERRHKEKTFHHLLEQSSCEDPDALVQHLIMKTWLPGNGLLSLDSVSMAHALEARVPYFDPHLMSAAFASSASVRSKSNKYLLRQAMREHLPDQFRTRPKKPFSTPIKSWFDHELADRVQDILLDRRSMERGLFDPKALERLVRRHFSGRTDHTELIFRLVLLELWQRSKLHVSRHAATAEPAVR